MKRVSNIVIQKDVMYDMVTIRKRVRITINYQRRYKKLKTISISDRFTDFLLPRNIEDM